MSQEHQQGCGCGGHHDHHHEHDHGCGCGGHHGHHHGHEHGCTDPNCSCGGQHGHQHDHGCTDPNCGCGGHHGHHHGVDAQALALLENTTTLTVVTTYPSDWTLEKVEQQVKESLEKLALCFALDGVILGHVKALLTSATGSVLLSMTKVNQVERQVNGPWEQGAKEACQVTVNAHSLHNTGNLSKTEMEALFSGKA